MTARVPRQGGSLETVRSNNAQIMVGRTTLEESTMTCHPKDICRAKSLVSQSLGVLGLCSESLENIAVQ